MESLLPKAILYPFIGLCLLALYGQYDYFSQWLADPGSHASYESLGGAFLIGILSSVIWIPTLVLVFWKSEMFSKFDRFFAIASACALPLGCVLSVVLNAST